MAEATEHPQVTYQPLSLLALAGFGFAVVYALAVLIGAAVALLSRIPWLMPYWTFLLPIAVVVVCWAARTRILNSEGTLGGLAFTTWGTRLAIMFGIPYAAYYFATFLALRGPAINRADDFFQKIKDGLLDQAFLMSQNIDTKDRSSSDLRNMLEIKFNQPTATPGMSGPFSRFCHERFVRFIEMDGNNANTVPTGVAAWEYGKGEYRMVLNYHVATSLVEFDMKVEAFGPDPKPDEPKARRWHIRFTGGETSILPDSLRWTPAGRAFQQKTMKAQRFAQDWAARITDLDALKPSERESYSKLIRGYETFWASPQQRDDISQCIRKTFQPGGESQRPPLELRLQSEGIPFLRENDGRTTARFDVTLRYFKEGTGVAQYVVAGRLVLSADSTVAADSSSAWQVDALEIESGRTAPEWRRFQQQQKSLDASNPQAPDVENDPSQPQMIRSPKFPLSRPR